MEHFNNDSQPTYVSLLCCGCSTATIPVAEVSHYWNIPQVRLMLIHKIFISAIIGSEYQVKMAKKQDGDSSGCIINIIIRQELSWECVLDTFSTFLSFLSTSLAIKNVHIPRSFANRHLYFSFSPRLVL